MKVPAPPSNLNAGSLEVGMAFDVEAGTSGGGGPELAGGAGWLALGGFHSGEFGSSVTSEGYHTRVWRREPFRRRGKIL